MASSTPRRGRSATPSPRRLRFRNGGGWDWVFMGSSPIRSRSLSTPSSGWARPPMSGQVLAPQGLALPLHALFLKVAETEGYEEILACTLGGGVDVSDVVLDGQQVAVLEGLHSRLGRSSRWRRLCRACRVGPLGNRHKRTDAHRSPASAIERVLRRGLGGGDRFPRRALRWVTQIGLMNSFYGRERGACADPTAGRPLKKTDNFLPDQLQS